MSSPATSSPACACGALRGSALSTRLPVCCVRVLRRCCPGGGAAAAVRDAVAAVPRLVLASVSAFETVSPYVTVTLHVSSGMQGSSKLDGIVLDSEESNGVTGVSGIIVSNNILLSQASGLYRPEEARGLFSYIHYFGNIARAVDQEVNVPGGPAVSLEPLETYRVGDGG